MKAKQWQAIVAVLTVVVGIEIYQVLSDVPPPEPPPEPAAETGETRANYPHLRPGETASSFEWTWSLSRML